MSNDETAPTYPLTIDVKPLSLDTMHLRQRIATGDSDGLAFEIDMSGIALLLTLREGGERIAYEEASLRPFFEAWIATAIERARP